jgi:hypothetical protein
MTMQNKRNRQGREGHNVTGEPQDSIHLGPSERIRLEDVPLDSLTGDRQVGNRFYNDARYLLKNKNSNWRLISAQILIDSPTAGRINASWYSTTNLLRTLTNSPLTFAGATSAGNLRWDLVELFDNGTASVKTGTQATVPVRPTPTENTLIAGEFIWDENGTAIPVETIGSFSNDRYSTLISPNTTGLYAKIWEGELSYVNNYGIFISYHEPTNPVNNDGTGSGVLKISWTCDTSKNIDGDTVKIYTYKGSVEGEFRLVQLSGNRAAIYHKSNHYWGRIQFRIVFQNSSVRTEDFVNLGPYEAAPEGIAFWDSKAVDFIGTTNRISKFIFEHFLGDSQISDDGVSVLIGTTTSLLGDKLRISGGKVNISNWVTSEGAFDKLSMTFGEERGFGYDPFTNTIFFGGLGKFPWKVDGDAADDSFVIEADGSVIMANLGTGSAGELILYNSSKKLVRNNIIPIEITEASVKFDKVGGYIHGNGGAITGNITFDFTGEILGSTAFMLHNSATAPTFPAETRIIKGSYVVNTDNYIWFCLTKVGAGRIVQVTISQV